MRAHHRVQDFAVAFVHLASGSLKDFWILRCREPKTRVPLWTARKPPRISWSLGDSAS